MDRLQLLEQAVEHAGQRLPAQGPISSFVHHNPLHAFEAQAFDRAAPEASALLGCESLLSEEQYRGALATGRILARDLHAVVGQALAGKPSTAIADLTTREELWLTRLRHAIHEERGAALHWHLHETNALVRFRDDADPQLRAWALTRHGAEHASGRAAAEGAVLSDLWHACVRTATLAIATFARAQPASPPRPRDALLVATGQDADRLVHPLLIRLCAAYLDQGLAYWPMPDRELGFYRCVRTLYGRPGPPAAAWTDALAGELAREEQLGLTAGESTLQSLDALGIAEASWRPFITETLLALRGWAGMMRQLEDWPERFPLHTLPGTMLDFLAVRLILDRVALAWIAQGAFDLPGPLAGLAGALAAKAHADAEPASSGIAPALRGGATSITQERAHTLFQIAQVLGWMPDRLLALSAADAGALLAELEAASELERRKLFHLAFERRYRERVLDALGTHAREPADAPAAPEVQAIFCLDEREESIRRHFEEVHRSCQTFGAAGFYGVAMYYRGSGHAHHTPLCPIAIKPQHEVHEVVLERYARAHARFARLRKAFGRVTYGAQLGSRTFGRGTLLTAALGLLATVPLVFRVLFPRLTSKLQVGAFVRPPRTRLSLEREPGVTPPVGTWSGFTPAEMATIVQRLLEEIGLRAGFAPLVMVIGHGASTLNNPHESAYNCGACGGGRGGPNARAFAQMANDPRIRELLRARGIAIPERTRFIGAYHNTTDDAIELFDTDAIESSRREPLRALRAALDEARERNAHERCRRFANAPTWLPAPLALAHVEARAADLAQPRPECGHATNALCIVGRRARTRGLFLDRRAFLVSYDPQADDARGSVLERVLSAALPVTSGINLEYFFSFVDPTGYGCGTKLPHNVTALLGVMDGHQSDLRTGLPWQMVEIHEPMRLLTIVETAPEVLLAIAARNESLGRLLHNGWIQMATLSPNGDAVHVFERERGAFCAHEPVTRELASVRSSLDWYRGHREHLGCARIVPGKELVT
jgi:hypothetical protein